MIVPYAPGGATDAIGRVMAERMKSSLGQPVIVENVTGAGGTIAVGRAARAAADGYTSKRLTRRDRCYLCTPVRLAKRFRASCLDFI
jgi:tripartite-type tricarboxylate transporter receptor subunit TctC